MVVTVNRLQLTATRVRRRQVVVYPVEKVAKDRRWRLVQAAPQAPLSLVATLAAVEEPSQPILVA
jgi:hypothetical protein